MHNRLYPVAWCSLISESYYDTKKITVQYCEEAKTNHASERSRTKILRSLVLASKILSYRNVINLMYKMERIGMPCLIHVTDIG